MARVLVVVVLFSSSCRLLPDPRLVEIERRDESGASTVTAFDYDDQGHIVAVEKSDTPVDGDATVSQWEMTWEDRGPLYGTPLVRVTFEERIGSEVAAERDLEISNDIEARTVTAVDDVSGDKTTVKSVEGNIATVETEDDAGTTTIRFVYELGNLARIESERDNDEGQDENASIEIDYLSDAQENIGRFTMSGDGLNDTDVELSYDADGVLAEQVLSTTLDDGRDVTARNVFSYDDEGRVSSIEHFGSVDGGSEFAIGESTFRYDEGEATSLSPTPTSVFLLAPLFDLWGGSTDHISSTEAESFVIPSW